MIYLGNGMYSDAGSNSYLEHYGVMGMRWGHRKQREANRIYNGLIRDNDRAHLRELFKSGKLTREKYRMKRRAANAAYKNRLKRDRAALDKKFQGMRDDYKVNKGKYKGLKRKSLRDDYVNSIDKKHKGFKQVYDSTNSSGMLLRDAAGANAGAALGFINPALAVPGLLAGRVVAHAPYIYDANKGVKEFRKHTKPNKY